MGSIADNKLQEQADYWLGIGRRSAYAYAAHKLWLFRRVETMEFVGNGSVKRRISVDFEMPGGLPKLKRHAAEGTKLVPIAVYPKWPPLMGFDFVGPQSRPISLLRRTTNKQLDYGLVLGMVDLAVALSEFDQTPPSRKALQKRAEEIAARDRHVLEPCLQCQLKTVIDNRRPRWDEAVKTINELKVRLNSELEGALNSGRSDVAAQIAATVDLAGRLADGSVLWAGVDGKPGTDRIVKFSYNDPCNSLRAGLWRLTWLTTAWRHSNVFISLPHAGRDVIYHLDIQAPPGCIEIADVDVTALPPADGEHDGAKAISVADLAKRYPSKITSPDKWVGPEGTPVYLDYGEPATLVSTSWNAERSEREQVSGKEASVRLGDGSTHVYFGPESTPSHRVFLQVKLAMRRQGFVTNCALAASCITIIMVATLLNLLLAASHLEPTTVLLSIVPVVLGYVLVRPGEQDLEHNQLSGVRLLALPSGAMPIIGAFVLVLTHSTPNDLAVVKIWWYGLTGFSVLLLIGLIGSVARARDPDDRQ